MSSQCIKISCFLLTLSATRAMQAKLSTGNQDNNNNNLFLLAVWSITIKNAEIQALVLHIPLSTNRSANNTDSWSGEQVPAAVYIQYRIMKISLLAIALEINRLARNTMSREQALALVYNQYRMHNKWIDQSARIPDHIGCLAVGAKIRLKLAYII